MNFILQYLILLISIFTSSESLETTLFHGLEASRIDKERFHAESSSMMNAKAFFFGENGICGFEEKGYEPPGQVEMSAPGEKLAVSTGPETPLSNDNESESSVNTKKNAESEPDSTVKRKEGESAGKEGEKEGNEKKRDGAKEKKSRTGEQESDHSVVNAEKISASDDPESFMAGVFNRSDWKDMKGEITLTLTNRRGDERVRRIDLYSGYDEEGSSRMLMRFTEPADVRGTAFLLIEHKDSDDDRRLWLPALRRVQRIATSGVGGNFMSSDFTYYDIGRPELEDWNYSYQGSSTVNNNVCELILGRASNEKVISDTGYSSIRWCVDPKIMAVVEADYTDRHGHPLKKLRVLKIQDIEGIPFATRMRMDNADTGHRSEMHFSNLEINTGIDDELFTERSLRRGR